jgi:hypothetical protein
MVMFMGPHSCLLWTVGSAYAESGYWRLYTWYVLCIFVLDADQFDLYTVSQEEGARLQEDVPYVKVYRYNPKHLYPKLNGYGDNGQRKVWSSCGSTYCTC